MERLPVEVLRLICAYLRDDDQDDLNSWSFVNHRFYEVAVPLIYETLNVRFSDYESLQRIVTDIKNNPSRRQFLKYTRHLNILAIPDHNHQEVFQFDLLDAITDQCNPDEYVRARNLIPYKYGCRESFFKKQLTEPLPLVYDFPPRPGYYEERNWEPLIWLIESLQHLSEMHYLLANMFPKCLLEVIHKHHPTCQLNVWSTQILQLHEPGLQGLLSSKKVVLELREPFEMELLRSPCLHAISMYFSVDRISSTHLEVQNIFPLLTMAPNLKHIDVFRDAIRKDKVTEINQALDKYLDLKIKPQYVAKPITLTHRSAPFNSLKEWTKSTDFSSLRAFEYPSSFYPLDVLNQLSKFPNLEYLYLNLHQVITQQQVESFLSDLRSLFAGLKPLRYLRICCPQDTAIIHEIFPHHGRTLKGFIIEPYIPHGREAHVRHPLYPIFSASDLLSLGKQAPYLEELRLPLRRSLGNQTECQLYEALGNFPSLHSLAIDLDCNFRESLFRDYNQFSDENPELPAREVFINAAMDERLAKAIWNRIDISGGGNRLRNLRLSVIGISSLRRAEGEIARRLARSFLLSRYWTYEGPRIVIREIGKKFTELQIARQLRFDESEMGMSEPYEVPRQVQEVVSSLWPLKAREFTFNFQWNSFPLENSNTSYMVNPSG